ncbi:MAG: hypothetical protein IT294_17220 [Deltaproteobacteria bacterium]|nr:hypothetical protein [Deltaproteobacteria bacterium]
MATFAMSLTALIALADPLDTPSERLVLAPPHCGSEADALRMAMLSIHAYVEKRRPNGPLVRYLDHVDPMSPPQAVTILLRDESETGVFLRRRALVRMLSVVPGDAEVRAAVQLLVGPQRTEQIYAMLLQLEHGGACDASDPADVANKAVALVMGPSPYRNCSDVENKVATTVPKESGVGIHGRVIAKASLDAARRGLDAQRWKTCSPLWGESYVVEVDGAGHVVDNGKCSGNKLDKCMPAPGVALPIGETYDTGTLTPFPRPFFEKFVCDDLPCDVRLMLRIRAYRAPTPTPAPTASSPSSTGPTPRVTPADPAYSLTYSSPEGWKGFPYPPVDEGQVRLYAEDPANGSGIQTLTVQSDKTFGFEDWTTDTAVLLLLRRIEMADYLADLVCCRP